MRTGRVSRQADMCPWRPPPWLQRPGVIKKPLWVCAERSHTEKMSIMSGLSPHEPVPDSVNLARQLDGWDSRFSSQKFWRDCTRECKKFIFVRLCVVYECPVYALTNNSVASYLLVGNATHRCPPSLLLLSYHTPFVLRTLQPNDKATGTLTWFWAKSSVSGLCFGSIESNVQRCEFLGKAVCHWKAKVQRALYKLPWEVLDLLKECVEEKKETSLITLSYSSVNLSHSTVSTFARRSPDIHC